MFVLCSGFDGYFKRETMDKIINYEVTIKKSQFEEVNTLQKNPVSPIIDLFSNGQKLLKLIEFDSEINNTSDDLSRDSFDLVDYDTKLTNLFYHSNPSGDWEINFSNVEFKTGDKFDLTVIVDNSSHFPLNVGINGQDVQVKWNKNVQMDSNNNPLIQENSTMKIVYEVYCLDSDISNALILADLNFF